VVRDLSYIRSRIEHEGVSFLTISLAEFGASCEACIERGIATRSDFAGFRRDRGRCLPSFLKGFTSKVFDEMGCVLQDADPDALYAIRQICYLCKKIRFECAGFRKLKAIRSYKTVEEELFHVSTRLAESHCEIFDLTARLLVHSVFTDYHPSSLSCGHGPGATADGLHRNNRRSIRQWYSRSEYVFPSEVHVLPNFGEYEYLDSVRFLSFWEEPPVKVVFVPKTLKTPRVIAVEPHNVQFMQQGLMKYFVSRIERSPFGESVRFRDQSVNYSYARRGSIAKHFTTIDLSEASDRISIALVRKIFGSHGPLFQAMLACRSLRARLPDGTVLTMNKFASMGSAMCFPTMSLCVFVIILAAVHKQLGIRPTIRSMRRLSKSVKVFGDDIIVPKPWHESVVTELEVYGLRVNRRKSFSESHFRESCGGDFYKGYEVTPVYLRESVPDGNSRWSISLALSLASTSDQFYLKGLWGSAQLLRDWIEHGIRKRIPRSTLKIDHSDLGLRDYSAEHAGLTYKSLLFNTGYTRWDRNLHQLQRSVLCPVAVRQRDIADTAVSRWFLAFENIGNDTSIDMETSVKAWHLRQKARWVR